MISSGGAMQEEDVLKNLETLKYLCEKQNTILTKRKVITSLSNVLGTWLLISIGIFLTGGLIGLIIANNNNEFFNSLIISLKISTVISLNILLGCIVWRFFQEFFNKSLYRQQQKDCFLEQVNTLEQYQIQLRKLIKKQQKQLIKEQSNIISALRKTKRRIPEYIPYEHLLYELSEWIDSPDESSDDEANELNDIAEDIEPQHIEDYLNNINLFEMEETNDSEITYQHHY